MLRRKRGKASFLVRIDRLKERHSKLGNDRNAASGKPAEGINKDTGSGAVHFTKKKILPAPVLITPLFDAGNNCNSITTTSPTKIVNKSISTAGFNAQLCTYPSKQLKCTADECATLV